MTKTLALTLTLLTSLTTVALASGSKPKGASRVVPSCLKDIKPVFGTFNTEANYYIYTIFAKNAFEHESIAGLLEGLEKEYKKMKRAKVELVFYDYMDREVQLAIKEKYSLTFPSLVLKGPDRLDIIHKIGFHSRCQGTSDLGIVDANGNHLGTFHMADVREWKKVIRNGKRNFIKQQNLKKRERAPRYKVTVPTTTD